MTESEWLASEDPQAMLEFLRSKVSDRKVRLFGAASWWFLRAIAGCPECVNAVELGERFADGGVSEEQRATAYAHTHAEFVNCLDSVAYLRYSTALALVSTEEYAWGAMLYMSARQAAEDAFGEGDTEEAAIIAALDAKQPLLLRDIFGNPFRPPSPLPPAVLAWNDRTVPRLAEAIYEDRRLPEGALDPARLGILADALLDAGCDDEELLAHLRSAGPHVRGCFAVDIILGRS